MVKIELLLEFLKICLYINIGILMWWFLFLVFAHDFVYRFHTKWFKLSVEQFDAIHYSGIAFLKILIFVFNIVPYVALLIIF